MSPKVWQAVPSALRASAEAAFSRVPSSNRAVRQVNALVHELQVHQIELEMQNEALRQTQLALEESRDRYVDLYEFAPVGYLTLDKSGLIIEVNLTGTTLLGEDRLLIVGRRFANFVAPEDCDRWYLLFLSLLKQVERQNCELSLRGGDGRRFHGNLDCVRTVSREGGAPLVRITLTDISERKDTEAQIHCLAYYDPLTHLPNRRLLHDRLAQALIASSRSGHYGAVIFLDLDNFKALNDTRGHNQGDQLLLEAARRLQGEVRAGDTLSRLGGDEFVVVLENLSTDDADAAFQASQVGEKIRGTLAQPYSLDGCAFSCTASLGITLFHKHRETIETLLKHADLALYKAKNVGRNALRFFDPAMQVALDERIALEADLVQALAQQQFHLEYQPQVNDTRQIIGAEALIRWTHPDQGHVPPNHFISLAEETGLIQPIGQWVLETACAQIKDWATHTSTCGLRLAINVSAHQFRQADFVANVCRALDKSGANPRQLKLELTESVMINNVAETIGRMEMLNAVGVSFSMDDFGTGYSSLSCLKRLPLDQLKIDRSFVQDLNEDANDDAIVQTIITMGRTLGLNVIAEGVETEAQFARLRTYGCTAYQGYLFSRALPLAEFERMIS